MDTFKFNVFPRIFHQHMYPMDFRMDNALIYPIKGKEDMFSDIKP